jgi:Zn finger protein HypA/HybF involved in hydrogenase expression
MKNKKFYCKDCSHTFEQFVLETALTALCPKCRQFVGLLQGLTFAQALVAGLILYAIFG